MHKGISVWIDVPLEALAQRIAAVGTASRPLLHHDLSGDAYSKVACFLPWQFTCLYLVKCITDWNCIHILKLVLIL